MKRCPECRRDYYDDTLLYCLDDGNALLDGPASVDEPATAVLTERGAEGGPRAGSPFGVVDAIGLWSDESGESRTAILSEAGPEAEPQRALDEMSKRQGHSAHQVAKPFGKSGDVDQTTTPFGALYRNNRLFALSGVAVFLLLGGLFSYRYFAPANSKQIESIAVMPFVNETGNEEVEYLSDGMTETLINNLTRLPNLKVIARNSVFRYKGANVDSAHAGQELGVRAVLTGRLQQRGDDVTVTAELVDLAQNRQLWGEKYQRKLPDLLSLQRDLAQEITSNLRPRLSGEEQSQVGKQYTENPEAYQLYLRGRHNYDRRTPEGTRQAIEYFQQAIRIDPNYALAYAGLANAYMPTDTELPPRETLAAARVVTTRALEIDDSLAAAHIPLARIRLFGDWDWAGAEREFKRSIELDPNNPEAHHMYSHLLLPQGRVEESLAESLRALELDGFDPLLNTHLGWHYLLARQYDQAIEQLRRAILTDPNFANSHEFLGRAYEQKGMFEEAIAEFNRALTLSGGKPSYVGNLGHTYGLAGRRDEARRMLADLMGRKDQSVSPYFIAIIYVGLGEKAAALDWLEKAYADRSGSLLELKANAIFDSLRAEPRFVDLTQKVGLPQ